MDQFSNRIDNWISSRLLKSLSKIDTLTQALDNVRSILANVCVIVSHIDKGTYITDIYYAYWYKQYIIGFFITY